MSNVSVKYIINNKSEKTRTGLDLQCNSPGIKMPACLDAIFLSRGNARLGCPITSIVFLSRMNYNR